jgi:arylsulfatase A-like enzyme
MLFADPSYTGWVVGSRDELRALNGSGFETLHKAFWRKTGPKVDPSIIGPDDLRRMVDLYDGGIRYTDDVLRGFFAGLARDGLLDDTLVVIFSDHGEEFLEHGGVLHEMLYQETLHVPLILFHPRYTPSGRSVDAQVALMDLMPTILELANIEAPTGNARSLVPLFHVDDPGDDRSVFSETPWCHSNAHHRSLRAGGHTFYDHDRGRLELFDTVVDPLELNDIADDRPDLTALLRGQLSALLGARQLATEGAAEAARELTADEVEALRALGYVE